MIDIDGTGLLMVKCDVLSGITTQISLVSGIFRTFGIANRTKLFVNYKGC